MSAARNLQKALRPLARQVTSPAVQRRTFVAAAGAVRAAAVSRAAAPVAKQQTRGVKTIDFAGHKEDVYERADWPVEKLQVCFNPTLFDQLGFNWVLIGPF